MDLCMYDSNLDHVFIISGPYPPGGGGSMGGRTGRIKKYILQKRVTNMFIIKYCPTPARIVIGVRP